MRRTFCVLLVVLLCAAVPSPAVAQEGGGEQDAGFSLGQNYPNPFNPETKIPFVLGEELFEGDRPVVVTIRIFNVLQQLVASPTALHHPRGDAVRVSGLEYPAPGRYEAYWDGKDRDGQEVASGVYFVQLVVNGRSQVRKMFVSK